MKAKVQSGPLRHIDIYLKIGLSLTMAVVGYFLTGSSIGEISLRWMYVYDFTEFTDWSMVPGFYRELRTGISPVWAFLDIFSYRTFGHIHLTENWLYRGSMVLMYILPLWLFAKSKWQMIACFLIGMVFLWATVIIHPGNPQVYDAYMPAMVLLLMKMMQWIRKPEMRPWLRVVVCATAGLLLSVIELTRPFVFMFMPIFLVCTWLMMRGLPRRHFVTFLIPILLLSGGWHAKMLLMHGQTNWTNHSGYNMYQSWYGFAGWRDYKEAPPRGPHLAVNINTEQHYQWSKELQRDIVKSWFQHPWGATQHVALRATQFFAPQTDLMQAKPSHPIFIPYGILVWLTSLVLVAGMFSFLIQLIRRRGRGLLDWLAEPEVVLMLFASYTITIFIVVEAREDARFLISVLPYLACLPGINYLRKGWKHDTAPVEQ